MKTLIEFLKSVVNRRLLVEDENLRHLGAVSRNSSLEDIMVTLFIWRSFLGICIANVNIEVIWNMFFRPILRPANEFHFHYLFNTNYPIGTEGKSLLARLLLFAGVSVICVGCASAPPGSYGVNAFGVGVTYSTPGWSAPVKVVPNTAIQSPALLVPFDSAVADNESATVTDGKITAVVPIVAAPVAAPVLAVPK